MAPSSISRRINSSITALSAKNYEDALIHFFPALDKTAKRRFPKERGVGKRIRNFISEQEGIITSLATGNVIRNINVNGTTFSDAIYKFGRNSIAHEGELDERLKITDGNQIRIGHVWELPASYITGLIVSVLVAPENNGEYLEQDHLALTIFGNEFRLNDLWGKQSEVEKVIAEAFRAPDLFNVQEGGGQGGSVNIPREVPLKLVESEAPVKVGSLVDIDFEGSMDGELFDGGKAENFNLRIGQNRMIPGFEDGILGKVVGDVFDVNVTFPSNYHAENLKNKEATFRIKLNKVFCETEE